MRPVLSPEQAAALDRAAAEAGIAPSELMERAGRAVARAALDLLGGAYGRRAVVVCGKGNNGGDGYVAARHLARRGVRVTVHALAPPEELREPARSMAGALRPSEVRVRSAEPAALARDLERADVAVDAIVGTGFRGAPEGAVAAAIAALNEAPAPVVAVDLPSGVDGATGAVEGPAVVAALTVTFGAAKLGLCLLPGAERAGVVRVVDIGFPEGAVAPGTWLTEPADVAAVWPRRPVDAHKRSTGVLLVVAGSRAMTGAPRLVARAAARIGAGLVRIATPASALVAVQAGAPEPTFLPLPETPTGTLDARAVGAVLEAAAQADALAIGPGLSRDPATAEAVREIVRAASVPLVLDADALNAFAGDAGALAQRAADAVLTPHAGEFRRLGPLGTDRLADLRVLAAHTRSVVLLKGPRTAIAEPSGSVRITPTGSSALATGGSGDVLTGVIGALLARGRSPFEAAWAGAYVHGLAGQLAGRERGEGVVAGDVAEALPEAVARVHVDASLEPAPGGGAP